jgi:hypothetical protein
MTSTATLPKATRPPYLSVEGVIVDLRDCLDENGHDRKNWPYRYGVMRSWIKNAVDRLESLSRIQNAIPPAPVAVPATDEERIVVQFLIPVSQIEVTGYLDEDSDADEFQGQICQRPSSEIEITSFEIPAAPVAWEIDEYDESVAARLWESRQ